jgi:hypothetical protein
MLTLSTTEPPKHWPEPWFAVAVVVSLVLTALGAVMCARVLIGPRTHGPASRWQREGAKQQPPGAPEKDVINAILNMAQTTPEGRVKLRQVLRQQGITVNIGTINIYLDALKRDGRVDVTGPPDDPIVGLRAIGTTRSSGSATLSKAEPPRDETSNS